MAQRQPGAANKSHPITIAAKMKAAKAVALRMEGRTFPDIAKELGYNSRQAAHDAVMRSLRETLREPAEELIRLDLERLDSLWQTPYLQAQGGDVQALAACMKIMERRARLLGLDAPAKQQVEATVITKELPSSVDEFV